MTKIWPRDRYIRFRLPGRDLDKFDQKLARFLAQRAIHRHDEFYKGRRQSEAITTVLAVHETGRIDLDQS